MEGCAAGAGGRQAEPGGDGAQAPRLTLRALLLLAMIAGVCLVAAAYTVIVFEVRKADLVRAANTQLLTGATFAREWLGPGYHSRIAGKDTVPPDDFARIVARHDELCQKLGLQAIWSVMALGGRTVFTSASHAVPTNAASAGATFLEEAPHPEIYRQAFATMQPEFTTWHDPSGACRLVLLPAWDRQHRPHLFAASLRMADFDALLDRTLWEAVLVGLSTACLFSLLALALARLLTRPIERLTEAIARMARGDPSRTPLRGGTRELATLANTFEAMRSAVQQKVQATRESEERYRSLVENVAVGVALISPRMEVLALNRQMRAWKPTVKPEECPACYRALAHPPRTAVCESCPVVQTLQDGQVHEATTATPSADGSIVNYRIIASPIKDEAGRVAAVIEIVEPVTERKRIETALQQSQAGLSAILESTQDIIFSLGVPDGRLRHFNSAFARDAARTYGVQVHAGMSVRDVLPAERWPAWEALVERAVQHGPFSSDYFRAADQRHFEVNFSHVAGDQPTRGLAVFIRDITARKQAEAALRDSEAMLRSFFDSPGMARGILELDGGDVRFVSLNTVTAEYLGRPVAEVRGKTLRELGYDSAEVEAGLRPFRQADPALATTTFDYYAHQLAPPRWLQITVGAIGTPHDGRPRLAFAATDNTVRKQAEAQLAASEQRYRLLSDNTEDFVSLHDPQEKRLYVSPSFYRATGWTPAEVEPSPWDARLHPDDLPAIRRSRAANWAGQNTRLEHRILCRNGSWLWVEACAKPVVAPDGQVHKLVIWSHDITERKQMLDHLRKSRMQLVAVLESTQDMIWAVDAQTYAILEFNTAYAAFIKRTYGVTVQKRLLTRELLPPARVAFWEALFQQVRAHGPFTMEYRETTVARDLEVSFSPILEKGRVVAISVFGRDVTLRKQAQQAFRESQAHLTAVLESTEDLICSIEVRTLKLISFNTAFAHEVLATYRVPLRPGMSLREILPPDRIAKWETLLQRALTAGRFTDEYRRPNHPKCFERTFNPIVKEGQAASVSLFARDITARRQAEAALRDSEEKFRRLAAHLESVLYSVDADTREFRYLSPAFEKIFGYARADIQARGGRRAFLAGIIEAGQFTAQDELLGTLQPAPQPVSYRTEAWWHCKDGTRRYVRDHWIPVYEHGRLVSTEGILTDITKERLAEDQLQESTARLKDAQRLAKLGHWTFDLATEVLTGSEELYDIFGWDQQRPPPAPAQLKHFFPPESWAYLQAMYGRALQTGETPELELTFLREDGKRGQLLMHSEVVRDALARVVRFRGTAQDVTERRQMEQQIMEISEREQRRIGDDLHDGVGQQIAAMRFLSSALCQRLAEQKKVDIKDVAHLDAMLGETLKQVRNLSRGLHPVGADSQSFLHSLRELARQNQSLFGVPCTFECAADIRLQDQGLALNLYRIAQEAVRNAATHGAPHHIQLRLAQEHGHLSLTIQDDGQGLPPPPASPSGLGLAIMRYRANTIGATLEIQSRPGAGVTVVCQAPLPV